MSSSRDSSEKSISQAVIRRLPRYFRYLRELIRNGTMRISSKDLAGLMNLTPSQIRQDLNCFGGFGQQGYGYNVLSLYLEISKILGIEDNYRAIIVGMGNLGKALAANPLFAKRGVTVAGLFDVNKDIIGTTFAGKTILSMDQVKEFCKNEQISIAVLAVPKSEGLTVAQFLHDECGIIGFWNFSNMELSNKIGNAIIENIHLGDSLMTLCYELSQAKNDYT